MKLSVCLAVFNEQEFIKYPMDSTYDMADEVIIVDGGSEDKTLEIAQSYGDKVKIIHTDNPPMFHINKQKAIEAAKGDWILQLDADEAVSDELKKEILDVIARNEETKQSRKEDMVAYWLPRKNFFINRFLTKGGQYPDYTVRLYKNGKAKFPCTSVHENVKIDGEIGFMQSPLLHYADPDFSRYLKRWDRYTTLDAKLILEKNEKVSFFNYFIWKPKVNFISLYLRHRGYVDGFPGFVFALFSSIRFWLIYTKVWQARNNKS